MFNVEIELILKTFFNAAHRKLFIFKTRLRRLAIDSPIECYARKNIY